MFPFTEESTDIKSETSQPTIIRIPENLLNMFTQKKEPVTLGLYTFFI